MARPAQTLAEIGKEARVKAQKRALLKALRENDWNLTAVGRVTGLGDPGNVTRYILALGLAAELSAAREAGKVVQGRNTRALTHTA